MSKARSMQTDENPKTAITQATPVQLGMVFAFLALVISAVWGAATMNAKLDVVISKIGSVESANTTLKTDLDNIKMWRAEIDRSGTKQLDDLRKQFEAFKTDFQIHIAQSKK